MYFMQELRGIKDNHLPLDEDWFDEDAEITDWCGVIDGKRASQNMCVAAIDIESDSYVLFLCNINVLHKILQYASSCFCISYFSAMPYRKYLKTNFEKCTTFGTKTVLIY